MLTLEKRQIKFSIVLTLKMHSRCVFKLLQRSDEKPCLSRRTTPFHGKVKTDDYTPRCKVAWTSPLANFTTKTRSVTPSRNDSTADNRLCVASDAVQMSYTIYRLPKAALPAYTPPSPWVAAFVLIRYPPSLLTSTSSPRLWLNYILTSSVGVRKQGKPAKFVDKVYNVLVKISW